jgi:hypothetical protein
MSNNFLNGLKNETNYTTTENGAVTHKTSLSYVLDYFAQGCALRNKNAKNAKEVLNILDKNRVYSMFDKAYAEDPLLALKILFYSRDVRGGQGEREVFKLLINHLAIKAPEVVKKNIHLIPEFGRWDDLYCLFGTKLQDEAIKVIREQLEADKTAEFPSLLAKWLKSENTSSQKSRQLARITASKLGLSPRQYRKTLSYLRKKINIVETKITNGEYGKIDYSSLPAKAAMNYRQAFLKHDEERYTAYLNSLKKEDETVKVNAKTLFPYEIIGKLQDYRVSEETKTLMEAMWKALPDYIKDDTSNSIAVADVSGSMCGTPMQVAISLALYLAERSNGPFKNHFLTFSSNPKLVEIIGSNLYEKVKYMERADWGGSTNIEATFDLILNVAIKNKLSQDEIPSKIFIISDMEFDLCSTCNSLSNGSRWGETPMSNAQQKTLFDTIKKKFNRAGYEMPGLVFWNVNSRRDNIPMTMNDAGVQLVSGSNPVLFETLLQNQFVGAYELMMKVIGKKRYNCITV